MLVGLTLPTSGRILIGGLDATQNIARNQSSSYKQRNLIGLCPQFDVLYDDLTVEEHLLFYLRLKGYPIKDEKKHVKAIIQEARLP